MSKFLNGLFDFVLRLLVRLISHLPVVTENENALEMAAQWGLLWVGGVVECYVLDSNSAAIQLRRIFPDGRLWWVRLVGLDHTEGTRTLYLLNMRSEWTVPGLPLPEVFRTDRSSAWHIEYSLPTSPRVLWVASAGDAAGLGVELRRLQDNHATVERLMRMSAYEREFQNSRRWDADNDDVHIDMPFIAGGQQGDYQIVDLSLQFGPDNSLMDD